jgi:hypothetical protein
VDAHKVESTHSPLPTRLRCRVRRTDDGQVRSADPFWVDGRRPGGRLDPRSGWRSVAALAKDDHGIDAFDRPGSPIATPDASRRCALERSRSIGRRRAGQASGRNGTPAAPRWRAGAERGSCGRPSSSPGERGYESLSIPALTRAARIVRSSTGEGGDSSAPGRLTVKWASAAASSRPVGPMARTRSSGVRARSDTSATSCSDASDLGQSGIHGLSLGARVSR